MTITRVWRGWTALAGAHEYESFLLDELFPSMHSISGFLGADVLRRSDGEEVAFIILTRFRCLDDIRAFAGEAVDVPVIGRTATVPPPPTAFCPLLADQLCRRGRALAFKV
jgi:hypothetical protein